MKSRLVKCYDYRQIEIKDDLRRWQIPDSEIRKELEALARDHSSEERITGEIQKGDCVRCICTEASAKSWKGRVVLLYPGRDLPGADEAEGLVVGRKPGDMLNCHIRDTEVSLRIEDVVRNHMMTVGEELIAQ